MSDKKYPEAVKVSVILSPYQVERVREIATRRGTSMTEVIRHAIATETFLFEELEEDGSRLFIERKNGTERSELFLKGTK